MNGRLLNLTCHDILYYNKDNKIACTIATAGTLSLIESEQQTIRDNNLNMRVVSRPIYIGINNEHLLRRSNVIIVSKEVAEWMCQQIKYEKYLIYSLDARSKVGKRGTTRLVRYQ